MEWRCLISIAKPGSISRMLLINDRSGSIKERWSSFLQEGKQMIGLIPGLRYIFLLVNVFRTFSNRPTDLTECPIRTCNLLFFVLTSINRFWLFLFLHSLTIMIIFPRRTSNRHIYIAQPWNGRCIKGIARQTEGLIWKCRGLFFIPPSQPVVCVISIFVLTDIRHPFKAGSWNTQFLRQCTSA